MRLSDTLQYTDFLDRLALQQLRGCGWKKGREEGGKDLAEEVEGGWGAWVPPLVDNIAGASSFLLD